LTKSGVVGPVRTGKSTFIKRFMEQLVIPNINDVYFRERARDELPQSGSGRTVMTAEPKFVPEDSVSISMGAATFAVRLIDCVGYLVNGALGQTENDMPRMVTTPWFDQEISMAEAAEIGTRKVINEHSTIGLVITTDGSITEIERGDYVEPEERVINELRAIGKPYLVIVNSKDPGGEAARNVCASIEERFGVRPVAVDCLNVDNKGIEDVIRQVLYEFPVRELDIDLPSWVDSLAPAHWLKTEIYSSVLKAARSMKKIREIEKVVASMKTCEYITDASVGEIDLGSGVTAARLILQQSLFFRVLREESGFEIESEGELLPLLRDLAGAKREYDKISGALEQVRSTGYGIVLPGIDELTLEEPEIVKQGGRFGVRLRASAPSIHMMQATIQTEISPAVGSEKQSEELVHYLLSEFEDDSAKIWNSNIFGKSLHELVGEGLNSKLNHMPDDSRMKLVETLERIINEGSGGLICIIL